MQNFLNWLLSRARERSTWLGLIGLLTALGVSTSPEQQEAITTAGVAAASLLLALTPDKEGEKP
jgi:hypothetical protein